MYLQDAAVVWVLVLVVCLCQNVRGLNVTNERKVSLECGGVFTDKQFVVESPGYPNAYDPNLDCSFVLKGNACPTDFNFQFLHFDLENSLGCAKDRLEIQDQDALCGQFNGFKTYSTSNGVLTARFISDEYVQGRGFRILITISTCDDDAEERREELTTPPNSFRPRHPTVPNFTPAPNVPFCCENSYRSKRFFLSSPNFPYSNKNPSDCVYHIYKTNGNVCRLRLHFKFFWVGQQISVGECAQGFLQIDDKHICGCRVGLKLVSTFDERWDGKPKVIRFKNARYFSNVFSGFAIEVVQDECPKRYKPGGRSQSIRHYNEHTKNINWPKLSADNVIERGELVSENTEILDDDDVRDGNDGKNVVRHFYFFQPPGEVDTNWHEVDQPRDIEETTYVDVSNYSPFLFNGNDDYKCRMWGILQTMILAKQSLWQKQPQCSRGSFPVERKCVELSLSRGVVQSPCYPFYYPNNLNICYRFRKLPGFCSIKLTITDFNIENSYGCKKDYFLLGNQQRYCGRSLMNTYSIFDLTSKDYEDAYFVTDSTVCGPGFRGYYEQVPCTQTEEPTTLFTLPTTAPTTNRPASCGRSITEQSFTVQVFSYQNPTCSFDVYRTDDACSLEVTFISTNLRCDYEYLLIDNKKFCGDLSGRQETFDFDENIIKIIYVRDQNYSGQQIQRLRLDGKQIDVNCEPDLEVPPERVSRRNEVEDSTENLPQLID